ncbi:DDB1- and CUL4-associated factor 1 [Schistosoma japonicum]|uniref:DDB1-and CUL4-associated factor 1 n=1 Tax=Schistosoma japonicum TaxID=6182 RepID=A0A4Z2CX57_SCHJA|nr:DDB1- and CUL4-associated factor 1 [Schistosoma japonicum]
MSEGRTAIQRCEELISRWKSERNSQTFNPVPFLNNFSELLEEQINLFFSTDPDPFDDRHPLRTDSSCDLGQILRLLSTHDSFLERLTYVYLVGSNDPSNELVIAASRLLCAMRLGVTLSFTLDEEDVTINTLYKLALSEIEPTNCYALFLLGSVLDNTELLYITRQKNIQLIPIVLNRLLNYTAQLKSELSLTTQSTCEGSMTNLLGSFILNPLRTEMKIRLSIAYLIPLAEYQDLMPFMYNGGILDLIYTYLVPKVASRDIRLTFEALRLLANLLCHRCVYLEFVEQNGLEAVLKVPRPSVAATAVSVVLYYTAYFEDAMERVCQLSSNLLDDLIKYSLWLVECSHPSARCYSLFFLHLVLCYGITFRRFEQQNGLVYLYNAICVLPLRLTEDNPTTLKDTTSWHVVRASLCAIRRFLEISLLLWIDTIDPSLASLFDESPRAVAAVGYRPITYTSEQFSRLMSLIISRIRPDTVWQPTQQLRDCGAIDVLYRIIARNVYAHNNWPCRSECTRLAVDIFNLMSITYDLADEIVSADVYSFPTSLSSATFLGPTPLLSSLAAAGDSPSSEFGSTDVTVHLPSPRGNNPTHRRGLINQLLQIVEQVGNEGIGGSGREIGREDRRRSVLRRTGNQGNGITSDSVVPTENQQRPNISPVTGSNFASESIARSQERTSDNEENVPESSSTLDERINGLHMLFSFSREDENWDVSVHKAILAFICTLVYRPVVEHEHPDQPIAVTGLLSNFNSVANSNIGNNNPPSSPPPRNSTNVTAPSGNSFKAPQRTNTVRGSVSRKRRHDETVTTTSPLSVSSNLCCRINQPSPIPSSQIGTYLAPFSESYMPSPFGRQKSTQLLYRQAKLWNIVRRQHGIMVLLYHLETKQPISEADSVRTLACRGLVGLARSEEVRSMLAKLPLFTKALLQLLMKEPVLPDRLTEHAEFCRYATMLIRLVVGTLSDGVLSGDMSLERVRRAEIVAKTRIQWDQEELLELIYRHLQSKGLYESATALQHEARLKIVPAAPSQFPLYDDFSRPPGETPPYQPSSGVVHVSGHLNASIDSYNNCSKRDFDTNESNSMIFSENIGLNGDITINGEPPPTPNLRLTKIRHNATPSQTPKPCRDRFERPSLPNLYLKPISTQPVSEMTLSKVVESFLLHQHSQCPHPVSVCPKFSLYYPHRCPEPRLNKQTNCCQRLLVRENLYGSLRLKPSTKELRHFLHRRFQPTAVIREADDDMLTACCFSRTDDGLFLGSNSGAIAWVNVEEDGLPIELFHIQSSSIRRLAHTRDGERLLVCSEWNEPATVVARLKPSTNSSSNSNSPWETVSDDFVFRVSEARHAEFSNTGHQDRLVATYGKMAKVFDLTTRTRVADLFSAVKQSGYILNKATFSPSDHLVLNDGVVWDLRCTGLLPTNFSNSLQYPGTSSRPIHKFDKFQDIVSGVFHPNGLEIIIGSAVWDLRTWRLLHTIQALDRLEVQFNASFDVIYAGIFGLDDEEYAELGSSRLAMQNMFRTVDAIDYSLIASVDVRHRIEQLALDTAGQSLALVEKIGENNSSEPITQCRIYMIGRKRVKATATITESAPTDEVTNNNDTNPIVNTENTIIDSQPQSNDEGTSQVNDGDDSSWETLEEEEVTEGMETSSEE